MAVFKGLTMGTGFEEKMRELPFYRRWAAMGCLYAIIVVATIVNWWDVARGKNKHGS